MFIAAKRRTTKQLQEEKALLFSNEIFSILLEEIPNLIFIINDCRQIIYANRSVLRALETEDTTVVFGKRPGETFECMHAESSHEGCGSTEYCTVCGFANAISSSENELEDQRECNILTNKGKALTLNVTTRPFKMNGLNYVFCAVEDISDKKMIVNLDRIFLHDITNTAGSIYSAIEIADNFDFDQLKALIKNQSKRLLDEINSHRILLTAESDDLRTKIAETNIEPLIKEIISGLISGVRFRDFIINTNIEDGILFTDSTLLSRVIQNLIKNALEASPKHLPIEVSAKISSKNELVLMVKNQTVIPREVQLKIFQRSFSTKGAGRGFGTYSIKLLTEKYLDGNVNFVSEEGTGTVFTIKVPSQKPAGVII